MRRLELAAALAAVLLLGCDPAPPSTRVVLVSLDTLRFDRLVDAQGRPSTMPRLRARAERGLLFTRFYAASSLTQPTHASLFTGVAPWEHGVMRNGVALGAAQPTLAEAFRAAGFATRAVVASFPASARFGLARGFDVYEEPFDSALTGAGAAADWGDAVHAFFAGAQRVTDVAIAALDALDAEGSRDQFLFVHYFDPHLPYGDSRGGGMNRSDVFLPDPAARRAALGRARAGYDADVALLDTQLERLFERLDRDGAQVRTHVFVVADHGESLGENDLLGHGTSVDPAQIHVPALLLSPSVGRAVRGDPATSTDVAATLLALAGVEAAEPLSRGRNLARPPGSARTLYGMRRAFGAEGTREPRLDGRYYALAPHEFYAVDAGGELYRGNADGARTQGGESLPAAHPIARVFRELQARAEAVEATDSPVGRDVERALEALGYLADPALEESDGD